MLYRRDVGQKGYRKGGMQDRWDAVLEATVQEWRNAGKEG